MWGAEKGEAGVDTSLVIFGDIIGTWMVLVFSSNVLKKFILNSKMVVWGRNGLGDLLKNLNADLDLGWVYERVLMKIGIWV